MVRRAVPLEIMWARVCREGGGRVQPNQFLRNMNVPGIHPNDGRRLEVVVNGLPLYHGMQIGIDATIVSPVRADGRPVPGADVRGGVALREGERRKRRRYRELLATQRCHLLVFPFRGFSDEGHATRPSRAGPEPIGKIYT